MLQKAGDSMVLQIDDRKITVSLTSFTEYLLKAGLPKITAVRKIRDQYESGYNQGFDYYKLFRDSVRKMYASEEPITSLNDILNQRMVESKRKNYEILVGGMRKFHNRFFREGDFQFFEPVKFLWTFGDVEVRVNPELGFRIGNEELLVKLYHKKDPLKKSQLDLILHLLQLSASPKSLADTTIVLLDVRQAKTFLANEFNGDLTNLLEAEALAFSRLWSSIEPIRDERLTS